MYVSIISFSLRYLDLFIYLSAVGSVEMKRDQQRREHSSSSPSFFYLLLTFIFRCVKQEQYSSTLSAGT